MAFEVDFNWASQGILEMREVFLQGHPDLPPNGLGPQEVTLLGNGRWQRSSSYYFNCGANIAPNEAPPPGEKGQLTRGDGDLLEQWFRREFPNERPNVLKDGGKWNFTLVAGGSAFNFHLLVS